MEPAEAIATTKKENPADTSAPAAANWLTNPTDKPRRISQAQLWANEPPWTGPAYNGEDEDGGAA